MSCEMPGGPFIDAARDVGMSFPPNWVGELPPPATREELAVWFEAQFGGRQFSVERKKEALAFFVAYEKRYYEVTEGEMAGRTFHRSCGGGAMRQGATGVFCAICGKLPDLLPPAFLQS